MGLRNREEILTFALLLESFTSFFLAQLLGIENYKGTKSFGSQGGGLSFSQRIGLLIDIGSLSDSEKNKFQTFMEVRNQFMHNLSADTYESCYSFMKGKEKFILKLYPQDDGLTKEAQLKNATVELANDILKTTIALMDKMKAKLEKEIRANLFEEMQPKLINYIKDLKNKKI